MTFAMALAHAGGTWLDEIVQLGVPIVVLLVLYLWSNRKREKKSK